MNPELSPSLPVLPPTQLPALPRSTTHVPKHSGSGVPSSGPGGRGSSSAIAGSSEQCCSCSRFRPLSGPQWVSLSDQRDLCLECVSSIVVDTKDAQPLYEEILVFYRSMG
jgi:hypothetical protein